MSFELKSTKTIIKLAMRRQPLSETIEVAVGALIALGASELLPASIAETYMSGQGGSFCVKVVDLLPFIDGLEPTPGVEE